MWCGMPCLSKSGHHPVRRFGRMKKNKGGAGIRRMRPLLLLSPVLALCLFNLLFLSSFPGCGRNGAESIEDNRCLLPEIENMTVVFLQGSRKDDGKFIYPKAYFIDRYEVTRGEYVRFLDESGFWPTNDVYFLQGAGEFDDYYGHTLVVDEEDEDLPVVGVNVGDATAYSSFYGKNIPTVREWRNAAGVIQGSSRRYPWGHNFMRFFCNSRRSGICEPARVGTFESGKSPCGCYDMVGNVAEWTSTAVKDSSGYAGVKVHQVMGGSFNDWGHDTERNPFDLQNPPQQEEGRSRQFSIGFRTVRRNALSLVEILVSRINGMSDSQRSRAILEMASSGEGMVDLLRLIDFRNRIVRFYRASGLITMEPLGDVDGRGGDGILMKHADAAAGDGCLTALTGEARKLWSTGLGLFDNVTVLRDRKGGDEKIAVFSKTWKRITCLEPRRGSMLWESHGEGEPQSILRVAANGRQYAITLWTHQIPLLVSFPLSNVQPIPCGLSLSLLRQHDLETGRVVWEKEFVGSIVGTEWIDHGKGMILVVLRNEISSRTACHLLSEEGALESSVPLGDFRITDLYPTVEGACRFIGFNGTRHEEPAAPVFFPDGAETSFLGSRVAVPVSPPLREEPTLREESEPLELQWLEVEVDADQTVPLIARRNSIRISPGNGGCRVVREDGIREDPADFALIEQFMKGSPSLRTILPGNKNRSPWLATGIDLQNRAAILRPGDEDEEKRLILLDGVLGSRFYCHPVRARDEAWFGFLLSSNGGSLLLFNSESGEVIWWKKIRGITAREPVFCDLDNDGSQEILVSDPSGEITVVDLMTGIVRTRLKKSGAAITNLLGMDIDRNGRCEIVAGIMDEGVYVLEPDPDGPDMTLKKILDGVEKAAKGL